MNLDNLHMLIDRYENEYYTINNSDHNEIFKWEAVKCFRDVWFSDWNKYCSFAGMFTAAKKESSVLIDNGQTSPTNGIVKLAEKDPDTMKRLFSDLFADDGGDIVTRQNHMDAFIEETEKLRLIYFPQFWKYKQDRHAVSCYLSFFNPEENYIYKYSCAETFAQYIEFGIDIGSGESFKLDAYYKMCDEVVKALSEHESLLEKHKKLLDEKHYKDESFHLLAFDIIYCSKAYNLFSGMTHVSKKESVKAYTEAMLREAEERERLAKVEAIETEIAELENEAAVYEDISLLNVQVTQDSLGTGVIIEQKINRIKVKYETCEKEYIINRKFFIRPTFEDDKDIVDGFTRYDELVERIRYLKKELEKLLI